MHHSLAELGAACCHPPEPGLEVAVKPWLEDLWPFLARPAGDPVTRLEAALDKLEKHLAVRGVNIDTASCPASWPLSSPTTHSTTPPSSPRTSRR
jgi:hypothetical protein